MPHAIVHVSWKRSIKELADPLAQWLPPATGKVSIVPAPLDARNEIVSAVRAAWRDLDLRSRVMLPRPLMATLMRSGSNWIDIAVEASRLRIDARLRNEPWTALLVIDQSLRKGPFALDLPVQFLHPADRLRLAAKPASRRLHADVCAAASPSAVIIVTPIAGGWLGIGTEDIVAGELWCLALAERWLPNDVEMQGPWEDPTLQRATELELGIRIPDEMGVSVASDTPLPREARELLLDSASRLGMAVPDLTT